jgi:hypothetical protein
MRQALHSTPRLLVLSWLRKISQSSISIKRGENERERERERESKGHVFQEK